MRARATSHEISSFCGDPQARKCITTKESNNEQWWLSGYGPNSFDILERHSSRRRAPGLIGRRRRNSAAHGARSIDFSSAWNPKLQTETARMASSMPSLRGNGHPALLAVHP